MYSSFRQRVWVMLIRFELSEKTMGQGESGGHVQAKAERGFCILLVLPGIAFRNPFTDFSGLFFPFRRQESFREFFEERR